MRVAAKLERIQISEWWAFLITGNQTGIEMCEFKLGNGLDGRVEATTKSVIHSSVGG